MIEWAIYYDDDTRFTNEDGESWEAPKFGAQVVGQISRTDGWLSHKGGSFLVHRTDLNRWLPVDTDSGLEDHMLFFARHIDAVVKGRQLTDERFDEIKRRAILDSDLPMPTEFTR